MNNVKREGAYEIEMLKDGNDKRDVEKRRSELIKQAEGIYHPACSLRVQRERKI